MNDTKAAWQQSIWVLVTLDGHRKRLITPAQRTISGLACRKTFNRQSAQVLEAFETYGPHKGFFVPRVEPSVDGEDGFDIHWDSLRDVLGEAGTASIEYVEDSTEVTVNDVLREHRKRKQEPVESLTDKLQFCKPFAEDQCAPVENVAPTYKGHTPLEMSVQIRAEYERRKLLYKRDRWSGLERANPKVSIGFVGIEKVYDEIKQQQNYLGGLLEAYRKSQLQRTAAVPPEVEEDMFDALDAIETSKRLIKRFPMAEDDDWALMRYGSIVSSFERAANLYSRLVSGRDEDAIY